MGAAAMLAAVSVLNFWRPFSKIEYLALIVMGAHTLGVFLPDLLWQKVCWRTLSRSPGTGNWPRVMTKYVGLAASVGFIWLLYWLFPEYHQGKAYYGRYWSAVEALLPAWAIVALPYVYWVDRRMTQPHDGLWQMGRLVLGRWQDVEAPVIGQHLLGWLVKGFFLPLMFTYFCDDLNGLLNYNVRLLVTFQGFYDWAYYTLYFIDVALVSTSYIMSLRATDTHIRSVEPTGLGWMAALLCYQPFWSLIGRQYLNYDTNRPWGAWLASTPWVYDLWGSVILALIAIYVWATVVFGVRFSNLTHRGIITNGPYRYTKHPAYLAKNLSWWLISMPFMLSSSLSASLRSCGLLLLLNGVYYVRAKTEERHLALDPVYIEYAAWIRAHGLLRFLDGLPVIGALARWRPGFAAGGDLPQRDTTAQYDHLPYTPGPRSRIGHEHKPKGPAARIVRR
jgi:Isoprenylcysteine carboxyl methyltransferase (ICMT) family